MTAGDVIRRGRTRDDRWSAIPEEMTFSELSGNAMKVYAALLRFGNSSGRRFPAQETIAERCHLSVNTVRARLRELEAAGWVDIIERERTRKGQRKSYEYVVHEVPPSDLDGGDPDPGIGPDVDLGDSHDDDHDGGGGFDVGPDGQGALIPTDSLHADFERRARFPRSELHADFACRPDSGAQHAKSAHYRENPSTETPPSPPESAPPSEAERAAGENIDRVNLGRRRTHELIIALEAIGCGVAAKHLGRARALRRELGDGLHPGVSGEVLAWSLKSALDADTTDARLVKSWPAWMMAKFRGMVIVEPPRPSVDVELLIEDPGPDLGSGVPVVTDPRLASVMERIRRKVEGGSAA